MCAEMYDRFILDAIYTKIMQPFPLIYKIITTGKIISLAVIMIYGI